MAARYRRAAARIAGDATQETAGPATGRLNRDDASRVARARAKAANELADPIDAKDLSKRVANARANAIPPASGAESETRPSTLRERAFANPKRARNAVKNGSQPAGGPNPPIHSGLNYGLGWPSAGGIGYGCWDDDWGLWFNWCHGGGNPWNWHGHSNWYWHANYWGCWPYGAHGWGWFWYPFFWYGSYSPSTVVIYRDATPTTTVVVEEAPAYPAEAPGVSVGEGVIEQPADAGTRVVDESMDRLLSPTAQAASRAATQNLAQGDAAFREGRFGDAVHFYAKAIEFQPDEGVLYLVLSDALFATGDYHYGAYALRKALELDPTLVNDPVDKHGFYADPKEFDRQLAVLETYLKDRPTDQDARLLLAANYLFGMRPAAAVDLLEAGASETLRKTPGGMLLLEAARRQQYGAIEAPVAK